MSGSQSQEKFAAGEDRRVPYEEFGESRLVVCDYCDVELELSDEELAQGWYVCPECNELSHLATTGDDLLDPSGVSGRDEDNYRGAADRPGETVECGHCLEIVILPDLQAKQGWFFCPHCQGLGQLDDYVTCLSCGSKLELVEEEWAQEWYRCPECGQVTHLVDSAGKEMDSRTSALKEQSPVLEPADQETDHDWVQLKTAVGPEEAALEVAFLRANGVEAFTWQQGAGRAYGLTVGPLGLSHIMVREDQLQLAQSILELEAEDSQEDDPDQDAHLVDCVQCGTSLELSDQEVAQGHFICPECQQLIQLSDDVICPDCQTELALNKAERRQGWYRCPECDQVIYL